MHFPKLAAYLFPSKITPQRNPYALKRQHYIRFPTGTACPGLLMLHLWPVLSPLSAAQGASLEKDKQPRFLLGWRPCWQKINARFPMSTQLAGHLCGAETRAGPLCLTGRSGEHTLTTPSDLIKCRMLNTQVSLVPSSTFAHPWFFIFSSKTQRETFSLKTAYACVRNFCLTSVLNAEFECHAEGETQLVSHWKLSKFNTHKKNGRAAQI